MELKKIIEEIKAERPEITSVIFVGCGASQAELYPAKYFLEGNAKKLRTSLYTANEFVHATPACVGKESIIITCSLGGNTPETVEASKKAMNMDAKVIASTRALDSRALDFLNRFQAKTTLIDAKDFGLGSVIPSTVKDYFNPMLITAVLRVYAEQLAILRNHPLTQRRYMWKLEY